MKEFVVSYTVTTNVTVDTEETDGLSEKLTAVSKGLDYGLGNLVAQGEYNLAGMEIETVPMADDDDETGGDDA